MDQGRRPTDYPSASGTLQQAGYYQHQGGNVYREGQHQAHPYHHKQQQQQQQQQHHPQLRNSQQHPHGDPSFRRPSDMPPPPGPSQHHTSEGFPPPPTPSVIEKLDKLHHQQLEMFVTQKGWQSHYGVTGTQQGEWTSDAIDCQQEFLPFIVNL